MHSYNQPLLPGEHLPRQAQPAPGHRPTTIRVLLFFALLGAGLYGLLKFHPSIPPKVEKVDAALPARAAIPAGIAEDLLRHLENAIAGNAKAVEELKRSRAWIDRTLPSLDRNYMAVEKKRLEAATAALEAVHRSIEEARQEAETAKNLLKEERTYEHH